MSRVREGFEGAFFARPREDVEKLGREGSGLEARGKSRAVAGDAGNGLGATTDASLFAGTRGGTTREVVAIDVPISGGSEEGGSEPMPGFRGVRNGDLNGLWSVFAASFSRRRLACGVDILGCAEALG
jgi:hypothetical protein